MLRNQKPLVQGKDVRVERLQKSGHGDGDVK